MPSLTNLEDLASMRRELAAQRERFVKTVTVCGGTGCQASRSGFVADAFRKALLKYSLDKEVLVRVTGCQGFCEQGPIVVCEPGNIFTAT